MTHKNFIVFTILCIWISIFVYCEKGESQDTTLMIKPLRIDNGRRVPKAEVLLYSNKDSLLINARSHIQNATISSQPNYYQTDTNGILTIKDPQGVIFKENKVYYFYIYINIGGKKYENLNNEVPELADSLNYSTLRPLTLNSITKTFPYLYPYSQ